VWVPERFLPDSGDASLNAFARIRANASLHEVWGELRAIAQSSGVRGGYRVERFQDVFRESPAAFYSVSAVTMILSILVLIAAGSNVLSVIVARVAERCPEFSVRLLLGATPNTLTRLLTWEVSAIVLAGVSLGSILGHVASKMIGNLSIAAGGGLAFRALPDFDWRVFLSLAVSAVALVLAMMFALRLHFLRLGGAMAREGRTAGAFVTWRTAVIRHRLMQVQIAVSMCLLLISGTFLRSAHQGATPQCEKGSPIIAWVDHTMLRHEARRISELNRFMLQYLREQPGVQQFALATHVPGTARKRLDEVAAEGDSAQRGMRMSVVGVSPAFFDVLGVEFQTGRNLDCEEWRGGCEQVVLSQGAAELLWPKEAAVGRWIRLGKGRTGLPRLLQVVGVVREAGQGLGEPSVYVAIDESSERLAVVVRDGATRGDALKRVTNVLSRLEPHIVPYDIEALEDKLGSVAGGLRAAAGTAGVLGGLAAAVAVVGLYGLAASLALQRRREFGIRRALGATDRKVYFLVAGETIRGIVPAICGGILIGTVATLALTPHFRGLMAFDASSMAAIAISVTAVVVVTNAIPVRNMLSRPVQDCLREL
jgi:putative ABC transport system permease protein